jgi:hypothetical protein
LHRRVPAQGLLDGSGREGGILDHGSPLVRPVEEGQHRIADQVDGGLEPGQQQQQAQRIQLRRR